MSIAPRMSIVLATDSYATIRPVIRCLSKQTVKQKLEVVLVTPDAKSMHSNLAGESPFAKTTVVEDSVDDLAVARAAGVRASSAPIVFIGETHSFRPLGSGPSRGPPPRCAGIQRRVSE